MKTCFVASLVGLLACGEAVAQEKGEPQFGKGFSRASYVNVYNCKVEFQSFDSTVTSDMLDNGMSFMYRIGSKERGMENEFKTYRVYDFSNKSDTKQKLEAYAKARYEDFEKSVARLKATPVSKVFEPMKTELVDNHSKKLQFEKIFQEWFATGNDQALRKQVVAFYSDVFVLATLDKTLALKNQQDKWRYTYAELYDIVNAKVFSYDQLNKLQNKVMFDHKIEVVVDPTCTKS